MKNTVRAAAALLACVAVLASARDNPSGQFEIVTLSNRADLVSGGDALVEVRVPRTVPLQQVRLFLNGADVTAAFRTDAHARVMRGVLTGLRVGRNELFADSNGRGHGRPRAVLTITNHPIGGPVLSGPQVTPFFCATPTPQPATPTSPATNASGLSTFAIDAQCDIATEYKLWYRSKDTNCTAGGIPDASTGTVNTCFKPYDPANPPPATDLAMTTTDAGLTVPYIVRVERGTMNRGIFDIAVLFDPTKPWSPLAPQPQWNGKVLYQFGASTGQPRRQFRTSSAWTNELALSRGYLVAQNSMSDSALNSNRVSMAETVMMMQEHIGDAYGSIRFTMGTGCSGGSINSNMNASIAPGQLDGIVISCAYPDSETTSMEVTDCVLLAEAYNKPAWTALMAGLTQDQVNAKKAAINGHPDQTGCHGWYNLFGSNGKAGNYVQRVVANTAGLIVPFGSLTNNCQLPPALVYDPVTNPSGARCSAWDWAVSIWGKAADAIHARDTRDNTGLQYGFKALVSGAITAEEFVTLNEIIGGTDKDSNFQAARSVADPSALDTAYRAGLVMSGRHLARTAVIDLRGWDDSQINLPPSPTPGTVFAIHYQWRSLAIRDRLDKEFGDHGNQVIWRFARNGLLPPAALSAEAFLTMDQWLTGLEADTSHTSRATKVRNAKPASAFDFCLLTSDVEQDDKVTDQAACDADPFLKPHSSPRQVAGGPRSEEILKCRLKPLDPADYAPVTFTPAQWSRLQVVFADGVCDWAAGGVGQQPALSPLDFTRGPGGVPLPPPPVSRPAPDFDDL